MIVRKLYYQKAIELRDRVMVEICVDRELLGVLQSKIRDEIEDVAVFQHRETDSPHEINDALNYIQDLITSYKALNYALEDISAKEGVLQITPDEDEDDKC